MKKKIMTKFFNNFTKPFFAHFRLLMGLFFKKSRSITYGFIK